MSQIVTQKHVQLGRYKTEEIVGTGISGVVYRAIDPILKRKIALKVLKSNAGSNLTARFLQEAALLAQFHHDCIPQIYDIGEREDLTFVVMEFIEGENLETQLMNGKVNWAKGLTLIHQAALTLNYIHQFTLHRDLKPTNIIIHPSGRPYIVDFGCAKPFENNEVELTKQGSFLGSYQYAPLEQILGRELGATADIFSLGMILYEILVGHLPYEVANAGQLIMHRMNNNPLPPHETRSFIPAKLSEICLKAIQREAEDRYPRMLDMAKDIEEWMHSEQGKVLLQKGLKAIPL
jgi:serine/threonine protein kinase